MGENPTQKFNIINTGKIPISWRIEGLDKLPKVFDISYDKKLEVLKSERRCPVEITFHATEQKEYEHEIILVVTDKETGELKQQPKTIKILSKAYVITVQPKFESEKNGT